MVTGFKIVDSTIDSLIYQENKDHYVHNHMTKYEAPGESYGQNIIYDLMRTGDLITTDVFDGVQLSFDIPMPETGVAYFDTLNSGWFSDGGMINMSMYPTNMERFPWTIDLVFTEASDIYTSKLEKKKAK